MEREPNGIVEPGVLASIDWADPDRTFLVDFKMEEETYQGLVSGARTSNRRIELLFSSVRHAPVGQDAPWTYEEPKAPFTIDFDWDGVSPIANGKSWRVEKGIMDHAHVAPATPEEVAAFRRFEATVR